MRGTGVWITVQGAIPIMLRIGLEHHRQGEVEGRLLCGLQAVADRSGDGGLADYLMPGRHR